MNDKQKAKERKSRFVAVRMTCAQGQRLDEIARRNNVNTSEMLRRLIEQAPKRRVACVQ